MPPPIINGGGIKTGAVKQIIDEIKQFQGDRCENYVTVIHCIAHNLELAVCDAKKNCQYLNRFEEVLKGIFHFYYYSPKKGGNSMTLLKVLIKN